MGELNLIVLGAIGVLVLYLLLIRRWKWGLLGLIWFIPVSGLPTLWLHPAPAWTRLLKDMLFVMPLYIGFALCCLQHPKRYQLTFPGLPVLLLTLFSLLVILQCYNPAVPNRLVALVGLKTWLFYLPMLPIGYHLIATGDDLLRFARVAICVAAVPAVFGLLQAVLFYGGRPEAAYAVYGNAASAATQMFTKFGADDSGFGLVRLPSLFTYVMQYMVFLLCMLPLAFGLVFRRGQTRRARVINAGLMMLLLSAGFASGSRAAFVIFPAFFVLAIVLSGKARPVMKRLLGTGVAIGVGLVLMGALLGGGVGPLIGFISEVTTVYLSGALFAHFQLAFGITFWGLGTGIATGPARFAFPTAERAAFDLEQIENYYAKAIVELGVPGLLLLICLLGLLGWRGYRGFRRLRDPVLRAFGAGFLSFYFIVLVYLIKGSLLDYDPINFYFWLLTGMLLKLPQLQTASADSSGAAVS